MKVVYLIIAVSIISAIVLSILIVRRIRKKTKDKLLNKVNIPNNIKG